ncbi:hypothetical protein CDL15_Pgr015360 [Punica granatum]|uniref:Actin-related protein 6 n=1 Tax=Punica granatum TaxID=22663 RepID=A0A218VZL2_PUNGR|nr:hypothetical protein CDL15_Pgr015360 [Punica granatum]
MAAGTVVVLDNGGSLIKAGVAGELDPAVVLPNCLVRPLSSKKFVPPEPLPSPTSSAAATSSMDLTSAAVRRPIDRGHLINPDLQREIWSHIFSTHLRHVSPASSSLLLTLPLLTLPSIKRDTLSLVFEDFNFKSLCISDSPSLVHLYEASVRPSGLASKTQCSLVVDCGFSFTHVAPVFQNFTLNYGVKRIDLGGKALTNYLKEMVSYRAINVMDESFIMDDVKEKLCFVSLDVERDLQLAKKPGKDNPFRSTYVLPDGVTHTKGFVKDPEEAKRYLTLMNGSGAKNHNKPEEMEKLEDRKRIDLTKNEFDLMNERFIVPEMIFRPSDLGMNEAGLAECIVRSVNSCHPLLHPVLYESIILTGGSTLFPWFVDRLEKELRPLVPDYYQVKITTQEDEDTAKFFKQSNPFMALLDQSEGGFQC